MGLASCISSDNRVGITLHLQRKLAQSSRNQRLGIRRCTAKTRYRQADVPCEITPDDDGLVMVRFDAPQRAVTPGQSVVFYDGEVCLGGGIIDRALSDTRAEAA